MVFRLNPEVVVRPFSDSAAAFVFSTSPPSVRILDEITWTTLTIADGRDLGTVQRRFAESQEDPLLQVNATNLAATIVRRLVEAGILLNEGERI